MSDRNRFDELERISLSCLEQTLRVRSVVTGVIVYLLLAGGCAVIALVLRKLL